MIILQTPFIFKLPWFNNFSAIVIGRICLCKNNPNHELIAHELVHQDQMTKHGVIMFYLIYGTQWVRALFKTGRPLLAYQLIPLEIEAYKRQSEDTYLRDAVRLLERLS